MEYVIDAGLARLFRLRYIDAMMRDAATALIDMPLCAHFDAHRRTNCAAPGRHAMPAYATFSSPHEPSSARRIAHHADGRNIAGRAPFFVPSRRPRMRQAPPQGLAHVIYAMLPPLAFFISVRYAIECSMIAGYDHAILMRRLQAANTPLRYLRATPHYRLITPLSARRPHITHTYAGRAA
jgi:hypothetical protein